MVVVVTEIKEKSKKERRNCKILGKKKKKVSALFLLCIPTVQTVPDIEEMS